MFKQLKVYIFYFYFLNGSRTGVGSHSLNYTE